MLRTLYTLHDLRARIHCQNVDVSLSVGTGYSAKGFIIGVTDVRITASQPPSEYTLCVDYSDRTYDHNAACQPIPVSGQFLFIYKMRYPTTPLEVKEVQVFSGSHYYVGINAYCRPIYQPINYLLST